jgi:hypothetical protein
MQGVCTPCGYPVHGLRWTTIYVQYHKDVVWPHRKCPLLSWFREDDFFSSVDIVFLLIPFGSVDSSFKMATTTGTGEDLEIPSIFFGVFTGLFAFTISKVTKQL